MKCFVSLVLLAVGLGGCGQEEEADHAVHWGYESDEGPERWADLDASFSTCRDGIEQSPINIVGATPMDDSGLQRRVGETVLSGEQRTRVLDIVDNGHTIQVANDVPLSMLVDGTQYDLVQYHFHAPSEHTLDGQHAPLEAHFVHKSEDGDLAVFGVLVEVGEHDPLWEAVLSQLPDGPGDERHIEGVDIDVSQLRPLPKRYYRYAGSLTTPPCSEGVSWVVNAEVQQISAAQLEALVSRMPRNNRPVQPVGDRTIGIVSRGD